MSETRLSPAERDAIVEATARRIREWGLAAPGIALLEANKPFSFLGSQFALFLQPLLDGFVASRTTDRLIGFLQDRDNIERLIEQLEAGGS